MRYCSCIKMVLDKVVNLKEFWWPNKEIKYFSRTSTEFKVLSRQLPKFKTCWRLYKPWLFLLWCFLARTKHNCCLWCMIEFNCTKVCKPMKDHERVAVAAEFWPLPVISLYFEGERLDENVLIEVVSKWQLNFYQLNNQNKAQSN